MADAGRAAALLMEWVWYSAAVAVIGGAGAYLTISRWARRDRSRREAHAAMSIVLRGWGLSAAGALVLLALIRLMLRTAAEYGGGVPTLDAMSHMVSGTMWGNGWWMQLYVALLAVAGLLIAGRRPRQGWSLAAAAALGVAYTLPMTGDEGAAVLERLPLALTALHVFGAGIWIGVPLLWHASRRASVASEDLGRAAKWTLAMGAGVAAATGAAVAALELDGIAAIVGTGYGRMLLMKGALAAIAWAFALSRPNAALAAGAAALLLTALL